MTSATTPVKVELFGVPRVLAGQRALNVAGATLAELAASLADVCPALAGPVIDAEDRWLGDGYIFVVDGRFSRDRRQLVAPDSTVLLVSSVAGG